MRTGSLSLILGLLAWMLACSGLADQAPPAPTVAPAQELEESKEEPAKPQERPTDRASTARPATLLEVVRGVAGCELVQVVLPDGGRVPLGKVPCSVTDVVLSRDGRLAWLDATLFDLSARAERPLPEVPERDNPVDLSHHFDAAGEPVVHGSWGEGEATWEEGPSWAYGLSVVLELRDGAWLERGQRRWGRGQASDPVANQAYSSAAVTAEWRLGSVGAQLEWVQEPDRLDALNSLVEEPAEMWLAGGRAPELAVRSEQEGEGECTFGPIWAVSDGGWTDTGVGNRGCLELARAGDWLLVQELGGWTVVDLTLLEVSQVALPYVAFWPEGLQAGG
jgi:hypothetical protein